MYTNPCPQSFPRGMLMQSHHLAATVIVLIVDDSALIRGRIAAMLEHIPNIIVSGWAEDATAAIGLIRQDPPDVVVLDISLKTSNGMEVLRYVAGTHPAIKVIVLSNYSEEASRARFLAAGAYGFYDKSLEFDKIRDAIGRLAAVGSG
jgi:DNA-binding NarL/FixJ family response regulator